MKVNAKVIFESGKSSRGFKYFIREAELQNGNKFWISDIRLPECIDSEKLIEEYCLFLCGIECNMPYVGHVMFDTNHICDWNDDGSSKWYPQMVLDKTEAICEELWCKWQKNTGISCLPFCSSAKR